jgi:hypothetical protein
MGFGDNWTGCMHTMGMPTPTEAWDSAVEALEKLHEVELALGGIALHEAIEQMALYGVTLEGGGAAAGLTVSWWAGVSIGCIVTAAVGDKIVDAIDFILQPINWDWIAANMNAVGYAVPIELASYEEASTRSSYAAHEDPAPPRPNPPLLCEGEGPADWVQHLQELLASGGYYTGQIDGIFGPITFEAVRTYQHTNGLLVDGIVGPQTWGSLIP